MKTPYLFWSGDGSILPLALKIKAEGHPVSLYIHAPEARDIGRGLLPKTTSPDPPPRSIVVFDGIGHGAAGTVYRKQGHPVIGGNPFDTSLEKDRMEGARLMKQVGIRVPETHPFRSLQTAMRFLEGHPGKWFVKVSGDQVESDTYDAPDSEAMIRYLKWCDLKGGKVEPFELQKKAQGTELSLNGWFDGDHFLGPYEYTLEEKRFLTGELGPRTGCESNLVWFAKDTTLAEKVLVPMEPILAREGYVGPLDLNMLLDEDGEPIGLEWTARLGFDATYAWMSLLDHVGAQLEAFAIGTLSQWETKPGKALTLRITVPPYPTWDPKLVKKIQGLPVDPKVLSQSPVDVMQTPEGLCAAGGSGIICTVGSVGTDLKAVRKAVLEVSESLVIPNKQFRIDPVSRADRDLATLGKLGVV